MSEDTVSGWSGLPLLHPRDRATVAALLPVVLVAGLTAWTMQSMPTSARGQGLNEILVTPASQPKASETAPAGDAVSVEPAAVNGLKISSQSWRRGGLGSDALVTFTLRNDNDYAVTDIEIACSFSGQDGSRLTERRRLIPNAVVNTKSRKTFARMHIGFVNIYANKAQCTPVAAKRV
jgi:hypothetical protein